MNIKKTYEYLLSAESGNTEAQSKLCQFFFDNKEIIGALANDFWDKVDRIAQQGNDYANFILHCRYFDDPSQSGKSYEYIRKAIRHKDTPLAILRLGMSYANGIGTKENHVLANYFYDMALAMGCQEADQYIDQEYESGRRNLVQDVVKTINKTELPTLPIFANLLKRLDRERAKKNYGYLSELREFLPIIYPDYNPQKAIDDILNNRDTVDAGISYSLSTTRNQYDICIDLLDSLQTQLFAPITQDKGLFQVIIEYGYADLVEGSERELLQCIVNLTASYDDVCEKYDIEKKEIAFMDPTELLPYFKVSLMNLLRRQAYRCLLSIKDINPHIGDYLSHLDNEEQLFNICEEIEDQDVQLFLISFIELNIDIEALMLNYHSLLDAYRRHQLGVLANHLNNFVKKLTDAGIKHDLPEFTVENLPKIELL